MTQTGMLDYFTQSSNSAVTPKSPSPAAQPHKSELTPILRAILKYDSTSRIQHFLGDFGAGEANCF
jgi:hypothetical protein